MKMYTLIYVEEDKDKKMCDDVSVNACKERAQEHAKAEIKWFEIPSGHFGEIEGNSGNDEAPYYIVKLTYIRKRKKRSPYELL